MERKLGAAREGKTTGSSMEASKRMFQDVTSSCQMAPIGLGG
jgi:hypothetical protein